MALVGDARVRLTGDATSLNRALRTAQQRLKAFGASVTRAGSSLTTKLTLPLGILGGLAIKNFAQFDFQMRRVAAVSGATGKQFKELTALAKELGIQTQFTATQSAEAMQFLAIAGFNTIEVMGALPGVLQLAAAGAVDLGSAADIAAKVMKGFGLEVEESGRINDVFIKTIISTNTTLISLGESFKLAGPIARNAGIEFEEVAAAIGLMGDAGFQGGLAGTSLRRSITALVKSTPKASKLLDQMGITVQDAGGKMLPLVDIIGQFEANLGKLGGQADQTGALMEIFGLRGGPAMASLIARGSDALAKLTKELLEAGGTAKRIADAQMAGLRGRLLELTSALEGAGLAFVESLLPGITKVTKFITRLGRAFANLDKSTQKFISIGVVIAAALGPVLLILGLVIASVGALAGAFGGLGVLLAPGAAIVIGLGALLVALDGTNVGFKMPAMGKMIEIMGGPLIQVLGVVIGVFKTFKIALKSIALGFTVLFAVITKVIIFFSDFNQFLTDWMARITKQFREWLTALASSIPNWMKPLTGAIEKPLTNSLQFIEALFRRHADAVQVDSEFIRMLKQANEQLDTAMLGLADSIAKDVSSFEDLDTAGLKAIETLRAIMTNIKPLEEITIKTRTIVPGTEFEGLAKSVADAAKKAAAQAVDPEIAKILTELKTRFGEISRIGDVLGNSFDANAEKATELRIAIEDLAKIGTPAAIAKMKELAIELKKVEGASEGFGKIFEDVSSAVKTSIDGVIRGTTSLSEAFANLGQSIFLLFQQRALDKVFDTITSKLKSMVDQAKETSASISKVGQARVPPLKKGLGAISSIFNFVPVGATRDPDAPEPFGGTGNTDLAQLGRVASETAGDLLKTGQGAKQATSGLGGFLQGILGIAGGGKAISGGGVGGFFQNILGGVLSIFAHGGGTVGGTKFPARLVPANTFVGAPRFAHGGIAGIGANEVPAILHRGERIIPAGQQADPMTVNVNISTPDTASFQRSEGQITAQMARSIDRARRNL